MKGTVVDISGRECRLYKDSNAEFLLVQPIDEHDLEVLDQEVEIIKKISEKPFSLVAFMIKDWNKLEWNPGNHFIDSEKRTAKGFAWVMNN